jgi:quinol monooxygenase YgiN
MWVLITKAITKPEKRQEFMNTVVSVSSDVREKKGNVGYDYHVDEQDSNIVIIKTYWQSWDDLEKFMKSDLVKVLRGAAQILCVEEETTYYEISK